MRSSAISKVLPSLAFAIVAAAIYLGVKYMVRGLTERDLWMALGVAIIVGVGYLLPWRKTKETKSEESTHSE